MAAIDKIYVKSYEEYAEIRDFFKTHEFMTRDGNRIKLSGFLLYDDTFGTEEERKIIKDWYSDGGEHPATNTPQYVDEWLFHNCPLESVQGYLRFAYGDDISGDTFKPKEKQTPAKKVILKQKGRFARNYPIPYRNAFNVKVRWYDITIESGGESYWYNKDRDKWYRASDLEPWESNYAHSSKSVKSIIRKILKKWKLPAGLTIRVSGRYVGDEWVFETKL